MSAVPPSRATFLTTPITASLPYKSLVCPVCKARVVLRGPRFPPAYVQSLIESFGEWDSDGDGVLGFDEFLKLWEHLGGDERARAAGLLPSDSIEAEFAKYALLDGNGQSYLDKAGIKKMMVDHGFAPTDQYLEDVWKHVRTQCAYLPNPLYCANSGM